MDTQDNKMVRAPAHGTIEDHHFINQPKGARMKELFFVSKTPALGAGLIAPGNWGEGYSNYAAVRRTDKGGDPWTLILELAIENARLVANPQLPSRLQSCFAFLSIEAAMRMNEGHNFGNIPLTIWACELVEPNAARHIGYFPSLGSALDGVKFSHIREFANRYWSEAHPAEHQEFVTASPLRLTRRLYEHIPGKGWILSPSQ